ncbi:MAG: site-specific DNA-methyltransferase [Armatimonadetes bacterium]|nr:site-specific DNA-methyltransferase [Armatimonadota bacterium]
MRDWRDKNKLNDLSTRDWLKFQKSWFIHNPPPRQKGVLRHPAKFPESMIEEFIRFFTKAGQVVLDPMAGTGSTVVAAARAGRVGLGVELQEQYAQIAREWLDEEQRRLFSEAPEGSRIITGDALKLSRLKLPPVDYCITSPPYWDMLRRQGFETQRKRAQADDLDMYYSEDEADLGNIEDYDEFLRLLLRVYRQVAKVLREGAYLTVIVKNVKKGGTIYPLAWDLGRGVGRFLKLKDEKIWCQDNQKLAPYGMGNAWVSNTMHHYCLNFRKERT